jgi:hypothetical protein
LAAAPGAPAAAAPASEGPADVEGGDLDIGEVSRVVKLTDIARRTPDRAGATRRSGANPSLRASSPSLRATGANTSLPLAVGGDGEPPAAEDGDPAQALVPIATSHRRHLIALLGVAAVMVLGVVGAVILFVTTHDDPTTGHLGRVRDIDTSRPEDPITHRPLPLGGTAPAPPSTSPTPRIHPRITTPNPVGSGREPELPPDNALRSDEIEDIARKHQEMTQRCYMRAQRGVDSILVGEVKKIAVTLAIDKTGSVSDVQLSEHAADTLGKCLIGSIKAWKFRPSAGGTFRITLVFS